jgi:hypothetical protein
VDAPLDRALQSVGIAVTDEPSAPLLHVVRLVAELVEVAPALGSWFTQARTTSLVGADIVTVLPGGGFETEELAPAMLTQGLVAGTRALAVERAPVGARANLVVVGPGATAAEVAATIGWLLTAPVSGQIVPLGTAPADAS